jgi:hypothetical protein
MLARCEIKQPQIIFDEGWWESISVNSIVVLGDLVQQDITQSDQSVVGTLIVISSEITIQAAECFPNVSPMGSRG